MTEDVGLGVGLTEIDADGVGEGVGDRLGVGVGVTRNDDEGVGVDVGEVYRK